MTDVKSQMPLTASGALRCRAPHGGSQIARLGSPGLVLALIAASLLASAAWAHGLRVTAAPTAEGIAGRSFYSDETAAAGERVSLADRQRQELAVVQTDADGRFAFAVAEEGDYWVIAEGEEGHRAEVAVRLEKGAGNGRADSVVPGADPAQLRRLLRDELHPIREELARYEKRIRLSEVIGGIGFIVGLAGAAALWRTRSSRRDRDH